MAFVVLLVLAMIVALVAIDAIGRLDERRPRRKPDDSQITSQKIIVDLNERR